MPYPEEMVAPMREEAVSAGAKELRTAEEVRASMEQASGSALYFINSVCGCSASSARPGLAKALRAAKRPDRVFTSFAGNDVEAVEEIRRNMPGVPPSSPSMALFRDGRLVGVLERHDIQGTSADELSERLSGLFAVVHPGLDAKRLLGELRERLAEELDYELEAEAQRTFAEAYAGDEEIYVPSVVAAAPQVLVTDWVDGTPLAKLIRDGEPEQRNRAGALLATLHFSAPQRCGLLHADPHPGNFRMLPDGRLGVVDFGAVARLPDGLPRQSNQDVPRSQVQTLRRVSFPNLAYQQTIRRPEVLSQVRVQRLDRQPIPPQELAGERRRLAHARLHIFN